MKYASIISLIMLSAWVLLAIADLWFDVVSWDLFVKVSVTLGLSLALVVGIALIKREYIDEKEQRKRGYLD